MSLDHIAEPLRSLAVPLADLVLDPANARKHDDANLEAIRGSLRAFGQRTPLVVNRRTGVIIKGNGTTTAARSLGWTHLAAVYVDDDQATQTAYAVADNRSAELATWDDDVLSKLLADLQSPDGDVQKMLDDLKAETVAAEPLPAPGDGGDDFDATPEETGPTRTNVGEVWVIGGKHRLMCSDSTNADHVAKLMAGETVELCFTSPPYAQQRDYGEAAKEKCQDWHALMCGVFANLPMKQNGQVLVNLGLIHRDGEWVPYWDLWIEWMREQGWRRFGWYVWDQGPGLMGEWNGRLAPSHEFIWHFTKTPVKATKARECKHAGKAHGGGGQRDTNGEVKERSSGQTIQSHAIHDSVFRVNRQGASHDAGGHPAPYPVGLPTIAIESWPGSVYEPFAGSGTTLIAAHRLGQRSFNMEIEPRYADVILRRCEAEGLTCVLEQ